MDNFVLWIVKFVGSAIWGFIALGIWYLMVVYVVMPLFDLEFIKAAIYYTAFSINGSMMFHLLDKHSNYRS